MANMADKHFRLNNLAEQRANRAMEAQMRCEANRLERKDRVLSNLANKENRGIAASASSTISGDLEKTKHDRLDSAKTSPRSQPMKTSPKGVAPKDSAASTQAPNAAGPQAAGGNSQAPEPSDEPTDSLYEGSLEQAQKDAQEEDEGFVLDSWDLLEEAEEDAVDELPGKDA